MKEDAVDSVVCDGEQECCEWSLVIIEDKGRLAIELVYLRLQVRAAGRRRDECGDPCSTLEGGLKVANTGDTPTFGATISD